MCHFVCRGCVWLYLRVFVCVTVAVGVSCVCVRSMDRLCLPTSHAAAVTWSQYVLS